MRRLGLVTLELFTSFIFGLLLALGCEDLPPLLQQLGMLVVETSRYWKM